MKRGSIDGQRRQKPPSQHSHFPEGGGTRNVPWVLSISIAGAGRERYAVCAIPDGAAISAAYGFMADMGLVSRKVRNTRVTRWATEPSRAPGLATTGTRRVRHR